MLLALIQHAEAFAKEEYADRPLTEEGFLNAQKTAAFLQPLNLPVDVIWHSDKTRSLETAKLFLPVVQCSRNLFQHNGISPNDPVEPVAKEILDQKQNVMIVGHLPFLSRLASLLLTGNSQLEILSFQKAAAVLLECGQDNHWRVKWMISPSILSGTKVAT